MTVTYDATVLEASTVPAEYGGRFDDDERAGPVRPEPMEDDPEEAIFGTKSSTPVSPLVDGELLTQGGVLQRQACPRHQRGAREREES